MAEVTFEVPESLLGDVYIAVGLVLQRGQDECDEQTRQAGPGQRDENDEPADQA